MVEYHLAKVDVDGSNPFARSTFRPLRNEEVFYFPFFPTLPIMSASSVFSHVAMATRWQLRFSGASYDEAESAAREAFLQIDRLESLLSRFVPSSDISGINSLKPGETISLHRESWDCLAEAQKIAHATRRAFDPTAGGLIDFWKKQNGGSVACSGGFCDEMPEWREAFENFRFATVALESGRRIRCISAGAVIDLGGIGKGFALDKAAAVLREYRIERALLSAGGSTILALDAPENADGWKIGFSDDSAPILLANEAVSSTGTQFQGAHLIDPRTGLPASGKPTTRVLAPSAAEADALSTAFYVMTEREIRAFLAEHPAVRRLERPQK